MTYVAATRLSDALEVLTQTPVAVIAGGTDWFPAQGTRPFNGTLLDITRIDTLRGITRSDAGWRIGATTTWSDVIRADLPRAFDALKQAAAEVGSVQIQNAGTIAGNLCNASPAADGVPPLMCLDAQVELTCTHGTRLLPLGDFLQGVRQTARTDHELLTAIHVPAQPDGLDDTGSHFVKLGARAYLVISIAMVAAVVRVQQGRILQARVSVGAASATAQRMTAVETALSGLPPDQIEGAITPALFTTLAPISDIRGSADYRSDAVVEATRRAVRLAAQAATGGVHG